MSLRRLVLPEHAPVDNPELPCHQTQLDSSDQRIDAEGNLGECGGLGETNYHDPAVFPWIEQERIREVEIESDQATLFAASRADKRVVIGSGEGLLDDGRNLMSRSSRRA